LNQGEDNYILSITLIEETIKISCDNSKGQIYSKIFTLEDIKSIDEIFASKESALDMIDFFDYILRNEKVRVEEESGLLQILFVISDERSITMTLDKDAEAEAEGEVEENYQQEQDVNYMEQTNENQLEENISANYYESMRNLNPDLEPELNVNVTFDTNAVNAQVNMDNFEVQQNEVNIPQEATNVEEYQPTNYNAEINTGDFNIEKYLKNNQAEINPNVETNVDVNNFVENTNTNYIQDTATTTTNINEFTNINTTEELNANINEAPRVENIQNFEKVEKVENFENLQNVGGVENLQNVVNTQSYENIQNIANAQTTETTKNVYTSQATQQKKEDTKTYSLPYISPVVDEVPKTQTQTKTQTKIEETKYTATAKNVVPQAVTKTTTTTETTTTKKETRGFEIDLPKKSMKYHEVSISLPKDKKNEEDEKRIKKLTTEQSNLKNQHALFNKKIAELTNLLNTYKTKITLLKSQKNSGEINSLRSENQRIRQQLSELARLRKDAAEAQYLRNQLAEFESLKQKAMEADAIKNQLLELNNLKMKIAQLSGIKDKINEMNQLKAQLNNLNNQVINAEEINNLKRQIMQSENKEVVKTTKVTKSVIKGDIIHDLKELEMITRKINKSNNRIILNLLYKATSDSDSAAAFHQKCDKARSSLVLVETTEGLRFGGFTSKDWRGDCIDKKDENAFVFSLDKMKTYGVIEDENAIGCYPNFGPIFLGCQIRIYDKAFEKGGTTFEGGLNYDTEEDFELNGGKRVFGVKDIEVYEVIVE
jgi:hypothetical protein